MTSGASTSEVRATKAHSAGARAAAALAAVARARPLQESLPARAVGLEEGRAAEGEAGKTMDDSLPLQLVRRALHVCTYQLAVSPPEAQATDEWPNGVRAGQPSRTARVEGRDVCVLDATPTAALPESYGCT